MDTLTLTLRLKRLFRWLIIPTSTSDQIAVINANKDVTNSIPSGKWSTNRVSNSYDWKDIDIKTDPNSSIVV